MTLDLLAEATNISTAKDLSKANFCFSAEIKGDPLVSICEGLISLMDTVHEFGTETLDAVNANLRRQIAKATPQRESIAGTLKEARRELNNRRDHRKAMIDEQQRIRDEAEAELEGLRETIRNAEEAKQAAVEAALGALEAAKREKTGLVNRKRAEYHEELEKAKSHQRELADQERELKHKRFTLYGQVERDVMTALKLFKDNDRGCLTSALRIILYQISLARGFLFYCFTGIAETLEQNVRDIEDNMKYGNPIDVCAAVSSVVSLDSSKFIFAFSVAREEMV